jgi:hypothetical protein
MTSKDLSLQKYYKARMFLYKNMTKQRFIFTAKIWQSKDFLYKNITKQRFSFTKILQNKDYSLQKMAN